MAKKSGLGTDFFFFSEIKVKLPGSPSGETLLVTALLGPSKSMEIAERNSLVTHAKGVSILSLHLATNGIKTNSSRKHFAHMHHSEGRPFAH